MTTCLSLLFPPCLPGCLQDTVISPHCDTYALCVLNPLSPSSFNTNHFLTDTSPLENTELPPVTFWSLAIKDLPAFLWLVQHYSTFRSQPRWDTSSGKTGQNPQGCWDALTLGPLDSVPHYPGVLHQWFAESGHQNHQGVPVKNIASWGRISGSKDKDSVLVTSSSSRDSAVTEVWKLLS